MFLLGTQIKKLRNEKGLTQERLAKKIGLSRGSLSMIEINKREPDNKTLQKLADFFDVSVDYLLGRTNERLTADKIKEAAVTYQAPIIDCSDDTMNNLPEEAKRSIEEFKEYILKKYEKK